MPKYPANEKVWETYKTAKTTYLITSRENDRSVYFLYELQGDKFAKLGKAKTPPECYAKFTDEKSNF